MKWSRYNHLFYSNELECWLLYNSITNIFLEFDDESIDQLMVYKDKPFLLNTNDDNTTLLVESRVFVESDEDEANRIILENLINRFNKNDLQLTIAPTRACNFDCFYCYEEDRKEVYMNKKVENALIDFVKNHKSNRIHVGWYGGEPTMAIPIIKTLTKHFKEISENYSASMITNGYMLEQIIDDLEELKINNLQITLDGTKSVHDQRRVLLNGNGTFDKIMNNVKLIDEKTKCYVSIRVNTDKSNSNEFPQLNEFVNKNFSKRIRVYPGFVRDHSNTCKKDSCYDSALSKSAFQLDKFNNNDIYNHNFFPRRTTKGCMAGKMNSYLIGPEGNLFKCWHHLGKDELSIGNILDDPINFNTKILADYMVKNDSTFDIECKNCILFPSCNGGCPELRVKGYSKKEYCHEAKFALNKYLEAHYKQKLKIAEYA